MNKRNYLPIVWFVLGFGLFMTTRASKFIPHINGAIIVAPIFILSFSRSQPTRRGNLLTLLGFILSLNIAMWGLFTIGDPTTSIVYNLVRNSILAILFAIPYIADRLIYPRIKANQFLATLAFPIAVTAIQFLISLEGPFDGDMVSKVEYDTDCGTLVVPENRADPNSRLIALPVIRVRATGDHPAEPIFYLSGGPGSSNLHFQHLEDVVENHDFVQVGYRGVDGSVVLDCPEIGEAARNARDLLSDGALESYTAAGASCADRLQAEGVDLAGYTLAATIDDNEAARVALGYERINLLGGSYGTRIEMIYQWMYPDSLHRVIMPAVHPPGHFVWDAEVIDKQIEDYARLCAQDAECSAPFAITFRIPIFSIRRTLP